MQYLISKNEKKISRIPDEYVFTKENEIQEILANSPKIVLDIPELELEETEIVASCREFPTSSGNIDVLYLTSAGEIVIVETKLIKNPEATRTVVAQVVDYVKSLTGIKVEEFLGKLNQRKILDSKFEIGENLKYQISQNLRTGYFKVVILGDFINPNILGMVESIQAAPHLAFSIFMVEINAIDFGEEVSLFPIVVANTLEVERSVIRLEISHLTQEVVITSEVPSKENKGNKPKKSWEQYIETIDPKEFAIKIDSFKNEWEKEFPNSISMGAVGFSAGAILGKKRIPIQYVYNNRLEVISSAEQRKYNMPDQIFKEYQEEMKAVPRIFDEFIVGGKKFVFFEILSESELEIIFKAAINLARKLKNEIL
jgi:hypothetical protein